MLPTETVLLVCSNFEIGSFELFRNDLYQQYFEHLDKAGGFFYERWGDAPVRSPLQVRATRDCPASVDKSHQHQALERGPPHTSR